MSPAERSRMLDQILRNDDLYKSFLDLAIKWHIDENVRFLRTLRTIPWNGRDPIGTHRDIYAMYVSDRGFWQVNLTGAARGGIEAELQAGEEPNWDRASTEIEDLLITQNPNPIDTWVQARVAELVASAPAKL